MRIMDCEFDPVDDDQTLNWAAQQFQSGKRGYITTVNCAILMMMRTNQRLKKFVERSALTVADGLPIIWLSKWLGAPLPGRVAGVDLVHGLSQCAADQGVSVYLLGAKQEIVERVAKRLQHDIPGIKIAGVSDGYFGADEFAERARRVRQSGAGLLIVAMGVPRQETFLEETWDDLGVQLAIGVGGSFDVLSGQTKRAPKWMQNSGLEWFYRMMQEPKRLFTRYLVTNTQFIFHAICAVVAHWTLRVKEGLKFGAGRQIDPGLDKHPNP